MGFHGQLMTSEALLRFINCLIFHLGNEGYLPSKKDYIEIIKKCGII